MNKLSFKNKFVIIFFNTLLFLICLLLGIWTFPLALTESNLAYMPGDLGDSRFINFVLEHGYQFIIGNEPSFYNATFFYPAKNTLALSDNMVGTLPIYALFRSFNFDRETAYQFWWLSMFVVNYIVAFYCFFKITKNSYAAILGAYLFAFSMIMFGQCSYTQLNIRFMLPVIIMAAYNLAISSNPKHYYKLVLAVGFQFVLGVYYAFLSVYLLVIFFVCFAIINKNIDFIKMLFTSKKQSAKTILFALLVIGLLAFYMQNYIEVSKQVGLHRFSEITHLVPSFTSYFLANDASIWAFTSIYGKNLLADRWWLNEFFMGAFSIILLLSNIIYSIKNKSKYRFLLLAIVIAIICSSLIANKYSVLSLFYYIPGFGSLSVLVRVITVIFTLVVMVNVLYLNNLFLKYSFWKLPLFIALFTLLFIDNYVNANNLLRTKKELILNRYKTIDKQVLNNQKYILAIVNETDDLKNFKFQLDAALYAQAHQMKSINGYSSNSPQNYKDFWLKHNRKTLNDWCIYNNIDTNSIVIIDNLNPITTVNNE
ncbi:MAG: hypothetical protein ACOYMA_14010 [Bacteroidia bacterium]